MTKWLVAGILGVILFVGVGVGGGWAWRYYTASIEGKVAAQQQIQSAPHRIIAYNHFFDLCAGVRADEVSLVAQTELLETITDAVQRSRVQTNIIGLIGHRAGLIEEYNVNARKDYTQGQFRDSDLPYQLVPITWQKGERMSCGN